MSTNYFNARAILPAKLIAEVLTHIPADQRERVLLYIQTDYYAERDAKVVTAFERAVEEERYSTLSQLYDALAVEFALSPRRISDIVRQGRARLPLHVRNGRYGSGVPRVRRMRRVRGRVYARRRVRLGHCRAVPPPGEHEPRDQRSPRPVAD